MSQNLNKAIDQAKKSEGYLVVITRLNDKKFNRLNESYDLMSVIKPRF